MPIDDALKEIDGNKKKKEKKEEPKPAAATNLDYIKPWHEEIIMSYITDISRLAAADNIVCDPNVVKFYGPWVRFNEELSCVIAPVPKSSLIQIFLRLCPEHIKKLLDVSDLKQYIDDLPNVIDIHKLESDYKLPPWMQVDDSMGLKHAFDFEECARNLIIIDLTQLSLFIEEGEKLRDYARFIKKQSKTILDLNDLEFNMHFDFNQISAESLLQFCQATGTKKIKKTLDDTYALLKNMEKLYEEARDMTMGAGSHAKDGIITYLFDRLQKYNPELVLGEKQNTIVKTKGQASLPQNDARDLPPNDDVFYDQIDDR